MAHFFVRLGPFSEIQVAQSEISLTRGTRVVLRSRRGVEMGEVLSPSKSPHEPMMRVLRVATAEDEMLVRRLDRHKRRAIEKCRVALTERDSSATLIDIDHLFDGRSIVLHFLGSVDQESEAHVRRIAMEYESVVRSGPLAKLLREGCGEGCGTSSGGGCGGNCVGCAVASVCHG